MTSNPIFSHFIGFFWQKSQFCRRLAITTDMLLLTLLHFLVDGICACAMMILSGQIVSDVEAYGMMGVFVSTGVVGLAVGIPA